MDINRKKSGIISIRFMRSNCIEFYDALRIPTVESYRYLGIIIDQTTDMSLQIDKLRGMESGIMDLIRLLRSTMLNVGSRLTVLKTIFRAKLDYGAKNISKY